MEELKSMLTYNNPCVRNRALSRLVNTFVSSFSPDKPLASSSTQAPEYELLLEMCHHPDLTVSHPCCQAFLSLVVNGHIEWKFAITQLLGTLHSEGGSMSGTVSILSDLLYTQMKGDLQTEGKYKCPFALRAPTHPLVLVLREKPDMWHLVLQVVLSLFQKPEEKEILEMLRPLLLYILLNPECPRNHCNLRSEIFEKLLHKPVPEYASFVQRCLPWIPAETPAEALEVSFILPKVSSAMVSLNPDKASFYSLLCLAVCKESLKHDLDISSLLRIIQELCQEIKELDNYSNVFLMLTSHMLMDVPSSYILKLCEICELLLSKEMQTPGMALCLMLPLIQILIQPPDICATLKSKSRFQVETVRLIKIINNLTAAPLPKVPAKNLQSICDILITISSFSPALSESAACVKLLLDFFCLNDIRKQKQYISKIKTVVNRVESSSVNFMILLSVIALNTEDEGLLKNSFDALLELVQHQTTMATTLFPLILYKLSKTSSPRSVAYLVQILPETVVHKFCISPVYNTFQALCVNPILKSSVIIALTALYKKQPLCFPLLLKAITAEDRDAANLHVLLAKTASIVEVIKKDPSLHGKELLSSLSVIINKNKDYCHTPAVVLCLQGIYELCQAEVIDLRTTLKAIMPKLSKDSRPLVVKNMLNLVSLVPQLSVPSLEYEKYELETASFLWKFATRGENDLVTGGAYRALAAFPTSYHQLKFLPEGAKRNLKLPMSKAATPFEMAKKPEDVLTYTPGYCFLDLLLCIKNPVLKDYTYFLSMLAQREVNNLPNSVYSTSHQLSRSGHSNRQLSEVPGFLCSNYDANRYPSIQSSIAVGVLFSYEPPVQMDRDGRPLKKSIAMQCKYYENIVSSLLQDVPLDADDWYKSFLIPVGWSAFMKRAFKACDEGRRTELEYQRSHGKLPGNPEEITAKFSTAWLCHERWSSVLSTQPLAFLRARDMLTECIKNNSRGRASSQGNGILALGGLIVAVMEYHSGLDLTSKQLAAQHPDHVSPVEWISTAVETVRSCFDRSYQPSGSVIASFFGHTSKLSVSGSSLVKGCAAVALSWLIQYVYHKDSKAIPLLLEKLLYQLLEEQSRPTQLFTGIGLGLLIQNLCKEGLLQSTEEVESKKMVKNVARQLMDMCFQGEDHDPRVGDLVGLTLALSGLCLSRDEELNNLVMTSCAKYCDVLHKMDTSSCVYEVLCMCTSVLVINAASSLLSVENVEELYIFFEEKIKESSLCVGTSVSLGLLVYALKELGHSKGDKAYTSVLKQWISVLSSENQPTLGRLSAVKGLCSLMNGGNILLQLDADSQSSSSTSSHLNDVAKLLINILNVSKDTGLLNCSAWLLGELYLCCSGQIQSTASVPSSYSYLGDQSVLNPLVNYISKSVKLGDFSDPLHACLLALNQEFSRALPPLHWTAILGPLVKNSEDSKFSVAALNIALKNGTSSSSLATFLVTCTTPPILHNLQTECLDLLLSSIPSVVKIVPASKIQPFLKLVTIRATTDLTSFENILKSLLEVFKLSSLPPASVASAHELCVNILLKVQQTFRQYFEIGLAPVMYQCIESLPEASQNCCLEGLEDVHMVIYITAFMAVKGLKRFGSLNHSLQAACTLPQSEQIYIIRMLLDCLGNVDNPESSSSECIRWFVDWMLEIKQTCSANVIDLTVLNFQIQLWSLFAIAWSRLSYLKLLTCQSDLTKSLSSFLPRALVSLLEHEPWLGITPKVVECLVEILQNRTLTMDAKNIFQGCLYALRHSREFKKSSVWCQALLLI